MFCKLQTHRQKQKKSEEEKKTHLTLSACLPQTGQATRIPRAKPAWPSPPRVIGPANIKNGVAWLQQVMTEIDNVSEGNEGGRERP